MFASPRAPDRADFAKMNKPEMNKPEGKFPREARIFKLTSLEQIKKRKRKDSSRSGRVKKRQKVTPKVDDATVPDMKKVWRAMKQAKKKKDD